MGAAPVDAALEIACLPDLTPELLTLIEKTLLQVSDRDGCVSMQSVQAELGDRLTAERVEALVFALNQAGALIHERRDRRGHAFDWYEVSPDCLRQTIQDAIVARHVLERMQAEQAGQVELVATLPDSLLLDPQSRQGVLPLAAALHRLITEAEQEVLILNPFFEQAGFDRLASALLAAAKRGVGITIITRQLSDVSSVNHQVLKGLIRQAVTLGVSDCFSCWQYQQFEANQIVLTSHAKVLVADGERAYIGSANLTEYGMARFLEVGVLLRGPNVRKLTQVLHAILDSGYAEEVTL